MSFGSFGISKFSDFRVFLMSFTSFFAILAVLLIIVAVTGWSTNGSNLKLIAWAKDDFTTTLGISSSGTIYIGLQGYSDEDGNYNRFQDFMCYNSYCEKCKYAGTTVLGLYLTSFFLMLIVIPTSVMRIFNDSDLTKIISFVLTMLSWIFLLAGFANWTNECYLNLPTGTLSIGTISSTSWSLSYYAGYGAAVSAWVFTFLILFFHILTPVTNDSSSQSTSMLSNRHDDGSYMANPSNGDGMSKF